MQHISRFNVDYRSKRGQSRDDTTVQTHVVCFIIFTCQFPLNAVEMHNPCQFHTRVMARLSI